MVGIQWPPIQSNVRAKPARLDHPLRRIMAPFAQAHERTEPEFIDVATMRLDVITDLCRRDTAALQTELAQRMREQLLLPDSRPAIGGVPPVPFRGSTPNAHGINVRWNYRQALSQAIVPQCVGRQHLVRVQTLRPALTIQSPSVWFGPRFRGRAAVN